MVMALLDIRQRTGYLFVALSVGHIVLISAQVNTERGVPMLEAVTFGAFAEVQRAATSVIGGVRTSWGDYLALQSVRSDNEQLRQEVARLQIALQQQRALAQQSQALADLLKLREQEVKGTTSAARAVDRSAGSPRGKAEYEGRVR